MAEPAVVASAPPSVVLITPTSFTAIITTSHPRLLASAKDFTRLASWLTGGSSPDPQVQAWYKPIKSSADILLDLNASPVVTYYLPDGVRLLEVSRKVLSRIKTLGLVYQIEVNNPNRQQYLDRAWLELNAIINFPDWHPQHFLDTAEMDEAAAIGYDWFYNALSPSQRTQLRDAINNKALNVAKTVYNGTSDPSIPNFWVNSPSNWNLVCNSGIAAGALAIANESPQTAEYILQQSFGSIPNGLQGYGNDGSYREGVGYWTYASIYFSYYLSSLTASFGRDFGMGDAPSFARSGNFPIYLSGPNYAFNYGDAGITKTYSAALFWLARRYNSTLYSSYQAQTTGQAPEALLWYKPELNQSTQTEPLDNLFDEEDVASFRSSWTDPNALFAAIKGGGPAIGHGDLDRGTFVLDANGQRWAEDFGTENYNLPGYFDAGVNGQRWTYYRKRAEGQNTLVISPTSAPDQAVMGVAPVVSYTAFNNTAYTIIDLTQAYTTATSVKRGLNLINNRQAVILQDEISSNTPQDSWWFMHTQASIALTNSNRAAILTKTNTGARLWVQILTPNFSFSVLPAQPLPTSPNPGGQNPNTGYSKLAVHITGINSARLAVLLWPLAPGQNPPDASSLPGVLPLDEWYKIGLDFIITNNTDNFNSSATGSLSWALANAGSGKVIGFAPGITTVTVSNISNKSLPPLQNGVYLRGNCDANGPVNTINGNGLHDSLKLAGNNQLYGLKVTNFKGIQLKTVGPGNQFRCVKAQT